jgi:glycosyltransferase involved in cell wall biosynthesis
MDSHQQPVNFPLVSVIVPAYNAETFIERTLNSVLSQTYKNIEVLVVDDGSSDQTAEIVRSMAQQDSRVVLLHQKNSGVAAARNFAIQKSQGEFIAPIDADDLWYPENLEKQVQCFLQADLAVGVVYAWSVDIDEEDLPTGGFCASKVGGKVLKTLVCHNFIGNASATLIRRSCFENIGSYNCQLKEQNAQGCEDWELYLRLAERYQFRVVPEFLIGYRKIFNSMSCDYSKMAKSHALMLQAARQRHPEIPGAIYRLSSSSFYLYLARQSNLRGSHRTTLLWLYKALQADCITPLLRYGLYALAIQSFVGIIAGWALSRISSKPQVVAPLQRECKSDRSTTIAELNTRQMSIQLKVLVGSILHRSMSMI